MEVIIMFGILFVLLIGGIAFCCLRINHEKYILMGNPKKDIKANECLIQYLKDGTRYVIENGEVTGVLYKA